MSEKGLMQDQAIQRAPASGTKEKSPADDLKEYLKAHPELDGFDEGHKFHWTVGGHDDGHGEGNPSPLFGAPPPADHPDVGGPQNDNPQYDDGHGEGDPSPLFGEPPPPDHPDVRGPGNPKK